MLSLTPLPTVICDTNAKLVVRTAKSRVVKARNREVWAESYPIALTLTGASVALLSRHLSNFRATLSFPQSRGFETSRYWVGCLMIKWMEALLTLVTLGRLTGVSLNKNGGSREAAKKQGSVWVEGERIKSPFLTRRKIKHKPNHLRNKFSLHLILFEIFEIQNPANWGLLKTVGRLTEQMPSGDWGLLVKWTLVAIPTFH